jgi:hypothetical protein
MLRRFCRPRLRPAAPTTPVILRPAATQAATASPSNPQFVTRPSSYTPPEPLNIPNPLPSTKLGMFAQHSLYPSSTVLEQIALIDACLAQGYVDRAKGIFFQIEKNLDSHNKETGQNLRMRDVVAPKVHTEFFRSCFRYARKCENEEEKEHAIADAWEWLYRVLEQEDKWGALEKRSWAVFLKGLVA